MRLMMLRLRLSLRMLMKQLLQTEMRSQKMMMMTNLMMLMGLRV